MVWHRDCVLVIESVGILRGTLIPCSSSWSLRCVDSGSKWHNQSVFSSLQNSYANEISELRQQADRRVFRKNNNENKTFYFGLFILLFLTSFIIYFWLSSCTEQVSVLTLNMWSRWELPQTWPTSIFQCLGQTCGVFDVIRHRSPLGLCSEIINALIWLIPHLGHHCGGLLAISPEFSSSPQVND